jgi:3-hydroxymyristoyl/3-hydroxydecanoyl-(acyl carrier protein) dehydratase
MWYEMHVLSRSGIQVDVPPDALVEAQADTQELVAEVVVPAGSRWFDGHFPGQPVLPGIAQLSMVLELIGRAGGVRVALGGLSRVRFRKMILPDDRLRVVATPKAAAMGSYHFRILKDQDVVTTGTLTVRALNEAP